MTDPKRYRDQGGELIGGFTVAELTDMLVARGVSRPLAERRARQRLGLPADPEAGTGSPASHALSGKREDVHLRQGDKLVMALGGRVYRLSQARPSKQSLGPPDRLYTFVRHRRWYTWEAKADWGRLSEEQRRYAADAQALGMPHVVGGYAALEARLGADGLLSLVQDDP